MRNFGLMSPAQKGLFHALVALAAIAEYFTAETKVRKVLLGVCTGYHAQAAYTHIVRKQ